MKLPQRIKNTTDQFFLFWQKHPLFFFSLILLSAFIIRFPFISLLSILLITLTVKTWKYKTLSVALYLATLLTLYITSSSPFPNGTLQGSAYLSISKKDAYSNYSIYKGTIQCFITDNKQEYYHLPFTMKINHKDAINSNSTYIARGSLRKLSPTSHIFYPQLEHLTPHKSHLSVTEKRFLIKKKLKKLIETHTQDSMVSHFFYTLLSGDRVDKELTYYFSSLGLTHLLVISGFHYLWIIFILSLLLRKFFSDKSSSLLLMVLATLYFLFIGFQPSIYRAWIVTLFFLFSLYLNRRLPPLNALGLAIILSLITNKDCIYQISFQLSFAATFGILAFFKPIQHLIKKCYPRLPYQKLKELPLTNKITYLIKAVFLDIITLNLSVNIITLPLILFHFHEFSLLSLIYNLFIPTILCLIFLLLIFSIIILPLSPQPLYLTEYLSKGMLFLVIHAPNPPFFNIYAFSLNPPLLLLYTLAIISLGIYLYSKPSSFLDQKL